MYILGIHGWVEHTHDAAACLLKDGQMVAMAEEERFLRQKYAYDQVPQLASAYCLSQVGIELDDVDFIAWGWDYKEHMRLRNREWNYSPSQLAEMLFPKEMFHWSRIPEIVMVPHHIAHAASVFRTSPFQEAIILVIDGQGESASTTLAYGKDNDIHVLESIPIDYSLGYFYEAISEHIGFYAHDAGKTMGLASYGIPAYSFPEFQFTSSNYRIQLEKKLQLGDNESIDEQAQLLALWKPLLQKYTGDANIPSNRFIRDKGGFSSSLSLSKRQQNIAASAQAVLEYTLAHIVEVMKVRTGCKNVCIAGGVGLNCVANGKLLTSGAIDHLFVQPLPNDAGVSLGAALQVYADRGNHSRFLLKHAYWGPEYTNSEIEAVLNALGLRYEYVESMPQKAAELIAAGNIVGWFQGRMEVGPRALGARSILADPRDIKIRNRVNRVKGREDWRPLAPSILDEKRTLYQGFDYPSPFMLLSFQVPLEQQPKIPGVVHIDGSARTQTVEKNVNPRYWHLIKHFEKLTGVAGVLNTSFNAAGEPVVCTPKDAIRTFYSTGLDYLAMENFLLRK